MLCEGSIVADKADWSAAVCTEEMLGVVSELGAVTLVEVPATLLQLVK